MTLDIAWFLPLPAAVIAAERGCYERRGLDVVGHVVRSSDEQYELLASGQAAAAVTAMDNVFAWNRRGTVDDVRIVAQVERTTGSVLLGAPGIPTIEHLRGGTLVVDAPENGFVVVTRALLRQAGLEPADYQLKVVGGVVARLKALASGEADAALLVPLFEPEILAAGGHVLGRVDEAFPGYPGQGLAVRQATLRERAAELAAWLDALREAARWATHNPAEATQIVMDRTGLPEQAMASLLAAATEEFRPTDHALDLVVAHRRDLDMPGAEGGVAALYTADLFALH